MSIPIFNSLDFYADPASHRNKYRVLTDTFIENYGSAPQFYARSPGRVNLMGDHIDYNFFPVLPMAIDADVVIAATADPESSQIILTNTDPKFTKQVIEIPQDGSVITIPKDVHLWGSYFMCSVIVAHALLLEKYPEVIDSGNKPMCGMRLTFSGTVPTGGGLSSSAALCVASTLAILRANGAKNVTKQDLTRATVVLEHYVGVQTGGMDQCALVYGESGKALLVQFRPELKGVPFKFPQLKDKQLVFLITNSLSIANKHETAPIQYNLRVVEMGIAADLMAHTFDLKCERDSNVKTASLYGVMQAYFKQRRGEKPWDGNDPFEGGRRLEEMLKLVEQMELSQALKDHGHSLADASAALELLEGDFHERYLTLLTVHFDRLQLYKRLVHVFSEALRVMTSLKLLASANEALTLNFLERFGQIMNESQASLKVDNESSSYQLDKLHSIAMSNGSYGSRVTGAGWGGLMVHLTDTEKLEALKEGLIEKYYKPNFPKISQAELDQAVVVTTPAVGSCLLEDYSI